MRKEREKVKIPCLALMYHSLINNIYLVSSLGAAPFQYWAYSKEQEKQCLS